MKTTSLMATHVAPGPDALPESEGIVVETDADVVRLELPGGAVVEFDRTELHAATAPLAA
jgi:hypothetical protein